jgi:hypothetical protein
VPGGMHGPTRQLPLEDEVLAALLAAEESAEVVNHLPFAPPVYGLAAFGLLMTLLAVTFAFRSVGTRND